MIKQHVDFLLILVELPLKYDICRELSLQIVFAESLALFVFRSYKT
jgi:hypothetical protein